MAVDDVLVSVVIPVYNGERFISRTLASVLAQTYNSFEVIVVDDGSTDLTPIIIEEAVVRDSRVRLFRKQNSGVAAARNFGISQALGELIATLDADDLWHPQKIARQVEVMQASSPEVGLVYCWSIEIDENDLIIPPISSLKTRKRSTAQGDVTAELARGCFIETASTPLMKRSSIDAVGGYDFHLAATRCGRLEAVFGAVGDLRVRCDSRVSGWLPTSERKRIKRRNSHGRIDG